MRTLLLTFERDPGLAILSLLVVAAIAVVAALVRRARIKRKLQERAAPGDIVSGAGLQREAGRYKVSLAAETRPRTAHAPSSTWSTVTVEGLRVPARIVFDNAAGPQDIPIARILEGFALKPLRFGLSTVAARGKPFDVAGRVVADEAVAQSVLDVFDAQVERCTVDQGTLKFVRRTGPDEAQHMAALGVRLAEAIDHAYGQDRT